MARAVYLIRSHDLQRKILEESCSLKLEATGENWGLRLQAVKETKEAELRTSRDSCEVQVDLILEQHEATLKKVEESYTRKLGLLTGTVKPKKKIGESPVFWGILSGVIGAGLATAITIAATK